MRRTIALAASLTAALGVGAGATAQSPDPQPIEPGEAWLAYTWYPDTLYLVRPDGSDRRAVELGVPGEPFAVSWSPDGERLAFMIRDAADPKGSTWAANADGSDLARLYGSDQCNDGAAWPVWAPDGERLALVCYANDGTATTEATEWWAAISVLDPATMTRTDLARMVWPESTDNPPSWSPDGTMLTFEIITWDPTDSFLTASTIATVAADGGEVTRLIDPALFGAHPDWSPDGSLIAFNTYDTGVIHGIEEPSNVYTIKPDGTDMRQLSTASVDGKMRIGQPFWSSDGSRIWVSIGRDWEKDSTGQFKNTLGWVDATTGELHEIGTEGKRFRERPVDQ
jgi:Tol biopolymer transport system component